MAGDEEYRSRGEREYARCRIAEYSLLRIAGVSLRGRRWEVEKENKLMPRGANDISGRTRPILTRSDIPFSAHEFSLIYTNWRLFVNGKEFQDCRGLYNYIFVLEM